MFENKKFEGIHYSRFIASWLHAKGVDIDRDEFIEWLAQLDIGRPMTFNEMVDIYDLGHTGKMELEINAKKWLANKSRKEEES